MLKREGERDIIDTRRVRVRQTDRQTDRQTHTHTDAYSERETDRQTEGDKQRKNWKLRVGKEESIKQIK